MQDRPFREVVEIRGHIIDSMTLPAIMDEIMDRGGEFDVQTLEVGRHKDDPSYARIEVRAGSKAALDALLDRIGRLGATRVRGATVQPPPAPADGVFPDDFYSTTNLRTEVNIGGDWTPVAFPEMDCAILVHGVDRSARCVTLG